MLTATQSGIRNKISHLVSVEIKHFYQATALLTCLIIAGCGGGGSNDTGGTNTNTLETVTLKGSVGDGPVVGATVTVKDANGALVTTTTSNNAAAYEIDVPGKTLFPVTITASGGTDIVSGTAPDFSMVTVALKKADLNSKKRTVNINPFSTFIVYMAQSMNGGLNEQNISSARQTLFDTFSFGLDPASIADPISTDIDDTNIAGVVKASESMGEMIRRTRDAMISSGSNVDGDYILNKLANDLADGKLDASGSNVVSAVSATAKVVSAQVLIETLRNQLKVNGTLATSLLDSAILTSRSTATMTTSDVTLTEKIISQTKTALEAVERFAPSTDISTLSTLVSGLSNTVTVSEVNSTLASDAESIITTAINLAPLATEEELTSINDDTNSTTPINDPVAPVINSSPVLMATEGEVYSYDVNASDANSGDTLNYSLSNAPAGMSINASTGSISWTPGNSQAGSQNVTVTVTDDSSSALSANQGFSIAVTAINIIPDNTAPVISSSAVLTAIEGLAYSYDVNASDADSGDTLSYTLLTAPSGMMINTSTGLISWMPSSSHVGTQDVSVSVSDNGSPAFTANQAFSIAVTAANVAPVITSNATLSAKQGEVYSYNVNATDENTGDIITYSLSSAPTGMSINASNGVINWTPSSSHVGTQDVSVLVSDNGTPSLSKAHNFTITVAANNGVVIRVNAGGGNYTDSKGQSWVADYGYNIQGQSSRTDLISGTTDDALYQSEHWHSNWEDVNAAELEYNFSVPNGNYVVILHFAEITKYVNRTFDVEIEGSLKINNFDITQEVGRYTAVNKNFTTQVQDSILNIRFPRNTQSPKVSAIEILEINNKTSEAANDSTSISIQIPESNLSTNSSNTNLSIIGHPANGSVSMTGNSSISYTANAGFSGQETIYYQYIDSNGTVYISTITIDVTCNTCLKESVIKLGWNPNPESISGYRVFYGPDANTATELAADIPLISGLIDPSSPFIYLNATQELNLYPGEQVCFKIQSYDESQSSDLSQAVCGII